MRLLQCGYLLILFLSVSQVGAAERASVICEGHYKQHLQGICIGEDGSIYWSFTDTLVKTDAAGKVIERASVQSHHGDLCLHDGKLYVAVNFGDFNNAQGKADSWVYVYRADDLSRLAISKTPEVFHGAGGIAQRNGQFYVVGGLPEGVQENYVYQYNDQFQFVQRHVIQSGYTRLGIQAATFADGFFWFGCYGNKLLKTDASFRLIGKYGFDCGYGIDGVSAGKFYAARSPAIDGKGRSGSLLIAESNEEHGLALNTIRE